MPTINSKFYIKSGNSPIFFKSYEALQTIIKRIYNNKDLMVIGTLDENDINRELGRVTLDTGKYPYVMIVPANISDNVESYNSFTLKKYGTEPVKHTDGYFYGFHLKPIRMSCSVAFYTQSFAEALEYMSSWSFNAREGTFKLTTPAGVSVDVKVKLEGDVSMPTKDLSQGSPLKVLSTITLDTYVGEIYKSPSREFVKANLKILTNNDFENPEFIEVE